MVDIPLITALKKYIERPCLKGGGGVEMKRDLSDG